MTDRLERALRSRPPGQTLRWVENAVGPGVRVTAVRRLRGGDSSAVHALTVERRGQTQQFVLRRFVRTGWLTVEPDTAVHEATVLRLLENTAVPSPGLVAVDEDGSRAGAPSVLMTSLPGRIALEPRDLGTCLARVAELLPLIHAVRPTAGDLPWAYAPYADPREVDVPPWTSKPDAWRSIIDFARSPRPQSPEHLIHRDYHPSNILWSRGRITGVVDWVNACRGPAGVDIGHCRRNLAILHGVDVADRFLKYCLEWADYRPYWDIACLLDAELDAPLYSGWFDLGVSIAPEVARSRLDDYAASLAARL